jgi:hypothetical protein
MMSRLATIDEGRGQTGINPRYVVDRLRHDSWILEPVERLDPYADKKRSAGGLTKTLVDLADVQDAAQVSEAIRKLVRSTTPPDDRLLVFVHALQLSTRLGEDFTTHLVKQVPGVLAETTHVPAPRDYAAYRADLQRKMLERALFLAAHYDQPVLVQELFRSFVAFLNTRTNEDRFTAINDIARECLRSLRKLGLRDEINTFLRQLSDVVIGGKTLPQLRRESGPLWPQVLTSLLALAEGWSFFGGYNQAKPFLDEARASIFESGKAALDRAKNYLGLTKLVRAYVAALAQGPVDDALDRIEELLQNLGKLPNTSTTAEYYSRLHLSIVEDVVRSLMSDNIALGDQARRWLDDDEYLVRRRIHGDMRKLLKSHGL